MSKPLVVITGASSGIGAAMAKIFSDVDYPLCLLARNLAAMEALNLPNVLCQSVDVSNIEEVKAAIEVAELKFGSVDCLINNAGFATSGTFGETTNAEHKKMVDVNLLGVINGIETVLPGMKERKKGTIINISSVADRNARPQYPAYAATKAAIKSLSESLRMDNAKYGIRVCNLAPGKVVTPMLRTVNLHDNQVIQAEEVAKAVLWMYEQPQTVCIRDLVIAPTYYEP